MARNHRFQDELLARPIATELRSKRARPWLYRGLPLCLLLTLVGCHLLPKSRGLPSADVIERDQLMVYSDFKLPRRHRLLDELTALREDVSTTLNLTPSDEPISVYLFDNDDHYDAYMRKHHPGFPHRRAFFVKNDTTLSVYAYWGEKVGEDLRHEVTHGYLHSVVANMPLWLDEGLAEYFEVPRGRHGYNWKHIELLISKLDGQNWKPDLARLDTLIYPDQMTQLDYAESWLWVHFFLETESYRLEYLRGNLKELIAEGEAEPLSVTVNRFDKNPEEMLVGYLRELNSLQE